MMLTSHALHQCHMLQESSIQKDSMVHRIPFWIGTERRVLSGIMKTTTCRDVIRSLIPASTQDDPTCPVVIVEKWKKMERKLDPGVRILKVWKAWGDQQNDVEFVIKHYNLNSGMDSTASVTDSYIDKRSSMKPHRRKSTKRMSSYHEGNNEDLPLAESLERLLKLVVTQGETIQAQLKKLRCKEEQIEFYEEKMHFLRRLQEGENYVVDSYLCDGKSSAKRTPTSARKSDKSRRKDSLNGKPDSKSGKCLQPLNETIKADWVPTDAYKEDQNLEIIPSEGWKSLGHESELMEKICELNKKLTLEEERLLKLGVKMKALQEKALESHDPKYSQPEAEVVQVNTELSTLRKITSEQSTEIQRNEQCLTELENELDSKYEQITELTHKIHQLDGESDALQQKFQTVRQRQFGLSPNDSLTPHNTKRGPGFPTSDALLSDSIKDKLIVGSVPSIRSEHEEVMNQEIFSQSSARRILKQNSILEDNDSNSDTGISSLHSSGDEPTSILALDTLV